MIFCFVFFCSFYVIATIFDISVILILILLLYYLQQHTDSMIFFTSRQPI